MAVSREQLTEHVHKLEIDPVTLFHALVPFLRTHLAAVETRLNALGVRPYELEPGGGKAWTAVRTREVWARLETISDEDGFGVEVAKTVVTLDGIINDLPVSVLDAYPAAPSSDGIEYRVRRRRSVITETLGPPVPRSATQSMSINAYARSVTLVPTESQGVTIRPLRLDPTKRIDERLRGAREDFTVLSWPFGTITYGGLDVDDQPKYVHLYDITNEAEVVADALAAVEEAERRQATILLFPELSVSPGVHAAITERLGRNGDYGFPILTVLGLCHARDGDTDVNEAVLLGPDGVELHRHRKVTCYSDSAHGGCGEQLTQGNELTILECEVGNATLLICLDLFSAQTKATVATSHATLLLVPSLSPKTSAHQSAAQDYARHLNASTFVCNRWLGEAPPDDASTFHVLPGQASAVTMPSADRYHLFRLADVLG